MPEGPELHLASLYVNKMCEGLVFSGAVEKSEVNKNPEVPFCCDTYCIKAHSRGKEASKHQSQQPMDVVFRFGMSGFVRFTSVDDLPKHAHLWFYTKESPRRVLSFEDTLRFGAAKITYCAFNSFRENVLSNLSDKGDPGPMVPKGAKPRKIKWKGQKDDHDYTDSKVRCWYFHSKEKPAKKKDNIKVKKENATSKTQNASKRQKKSTKRVNAEPADKNKKPKTQGKRSSKVPPKAGTNTIKGQHVEEVIKTKRNSVTCRKTKSQQKSSGTRRGRSK
uniref:Nei-like DNA glycosylase 1 n=1 Tax=Sinocyclocheilus rhinocerous TaxID=307959 RepID=A0A673NLC5_9TELE